MLLLGPKNDVISKKKGLLRNFIALSGLNQADRMRLRWVFHFSMTFGWAPSRAHEPPKIHGPQGHCPPPAPPLGGPDCDILVV